MMNQGDLNDARDGVNVLLGSPLMDESSTARLRTEIENLLRCLDNAIKALVSDAESKAAKKSLPARAFTIASSSRDELASERIVSASTPTPSAYAELDRALQIARAFEPVELERFEPLASTSR